MPDKPLGFISVVLGTVQPQREGPGLNRRFILFPGRQYKRYIRNIQRERTPVSPNNDLKIYVILSYRKKLSNLNSIYKTETVYSKDKK